MLQHLVLKTSSRPCRRTLPTCSKVEERSEPPSTVLYIGAEHPVPHGELDAKLTEGEVTFACPALITTQPTSTRRGTERCHGTIKTAKEAPRCMQAHSDVCYRGLIPSLMLDSLQSAVGSVMISGMDAMAQLSDSYELVRERAMVSYMGPLYCSFLASSQLNRASIITSTPYPDDPHNQACPVPNTTSQTLDTLFSDLIVPTALFGATDAQGVTKKSSNTGTATRPRLAGPHTNAEPAYRHSNRQTISLISGPSRDPQSSNRDSGQQNRAIDVVPTEDQTEEPSTIPLPWTLMTNIRLGGRRARNNNRHC